MVDQLAEGCYIVLHIGTGPSLEEETNRGPMIVSDSRSRFELSDDAWIERLAEPVARNIQKACEPANYSIDVAAHDRHIYAFVHRIPAVEATRYEGASQLHAVIALSRIIHPTSIGSRYCALVYRFGMPDSPILAIPPRGVSLDVFTNNTVGDWLSVEHGEKLRNLMPWVSSRKQMHDRVHRAYWQHEYAMRSYYLDARWTAVISGLEALINVGKDDNSWQFQDRVRQLGEELQISFAQGELKTAYDLRSKLIHAEGFLFNLESLLPRNDQIGLYTKLESVLRGTTRRCLEDESFGDHFREDAAVQSRWPLSPKPTN